MAFRLTTIRYLSREHSEPKRATDRNSALTFPRSELAESGETIGDVEVDLVGRRGSEFRDEVKALVR